MSDWPASPTTLGLVGAINPRSNTSIGSSLSVANAIHGNGTWPSANLAVYVPFTVERGMTVTQLGWINGNVVSGNVDCGVYTVAGTRVVSTGSTAQATVSVLQLVDITDTVLAPGCYFLALAVDNVTAVMLRTATLTAPFLDGIGVKNQASAFPLPSTATFAAPSQAYVPNSVAALRAVI